MVSMSIAETLIWPALVAGALLLIATWWSPEARFSRRVYQYVLWCVTLRYIAWRFSDTLPPFRGDWQSWAIYVFFAMETLSLVLFLRGRSVLPSPINRSLQADMGTGWHEQLPRPPLVDAFVPTYNENWQVLEKTFVGLQQLRYPRLRVWILDDGRRDWLRAAAEAAGFHYLTRPDNRHYKAGNLNHALEHVRSLEQTPDFIAVFDADFAAQPSFIERTLALMADAKVAIVQTPQTFYNPDPFQFGLSGEHCWPDEQRFLFDTRMPAVDAVGGAQCCGTSFLLRVAALDALGGYFPTDTICEDTMTSVMLAQRGWRTVYLMERLSAGLNAEGLEEFLMQRARWCLGGVQIALWSFRRERSVLGKLYAVEAMVRWGYQSLMQLLWLTVPILFWLTGFSLLHGRAVDIVQYVIPVSLMRGYMSWMTRRTQMPIVSDSMNLMLAPTAVKATLKGLLPNRKHAFRVTNKGLTRSGTVIHWNVVLFSGGVLLLLLGGMLYRTLDTHFAGVANYRFWNYYIAAQQTLVLLVVLLVGIERPRHRSCDRYPTLESVSVLSGGRVWPAQLCDLSLSGMKLRCSLPLLVGQQVQVVVAEVGRVQATVVRNVAAGEFGLSVQLGQHRARMIGKIYCSKLCIPDRSWRALPSLRAVLTTAVRTVAELAASIWRWPLPAAAPTSLAPARMNAARGA